SPLRIDKDLVVRLNNASGDILHLTGGGAALSVIDILKWPGVLCDSNHIADGTETQALALFHETLGELVEARQREGTELHGYILKRIAAIRDIVATVRAMMPEILAHQQENLRTRLEDLKIELDQSRLE